jgi:hypothetical protein
VRDDFCVGRKHSWSRVIAGQLDRPTVPDLLSKEHRGSLVPLPAIALPRMHHTQTVEDLNAVDRGGILRTTENGERAV